MEGDYGRGGVARERENDAAGGAVARVGFEGDGGKGGRFAGFHGYPAEVDGSA